MKVKEVADLLGVSVRTLHHYDEIGLLTPDEITKAGYRLYSDENLEMLEQILSFKELGFPLKEIKRLLIVHYLKDKKPLNFNAECLLKKEAQEGIEEWYHFLNKLGNYSPEAFKGLGQMYVDYVRFTKNIDQFGEGLAAFMRDAMAVYADNKEK